VTPCREHEPLVAARIAGDISAGDAARLEAHLAGCPACRGEVAGCEAALDAARLPPVSDEERRAFADLAPALLAEQPRRAARRTATRWFAVGLAAAAAAVLAISAPALLRRTPAPLPPPAGALAQLDGVGQQRGAAGQEDLVVEASWEPDLDQLWADTAILDLDE
jgi:anti-sigma factor RsiW